MGFGITASALRVELDCCLHLPQTRVGTGHRPVGEDSIFPGWLFDAAQSVGTTASLLEGGGTRQRGGGSCASLLFTPSVCIRRQLSPLPHPLRGSLEVAHSCSMHLPTRGERPLPALCHKRGLGPHTVRLGEFLAHDFHNALGDGANLVLVFPFHHDPQEGFCAGGAHHYSAPAA